MAILKQYKARNRSPKRHLGDNGVALAFSPDGIVVGDEVLDTATFHPIQNKQATGLKALVNSGYAQNTALISDSPTATMLHYTNESAALDNDKSSHYHNNLEVANLNIDTRLANGSAFKFTDGSGKTHWLIDLGRINTTLVHTQPYLVMVQGESLINPEAVFTKTMDLPSSITTRLSAVNGIYDYNVMAIDSANKQIFFRVFARNSGNRHYGASSVFVADYTTTPVDGSMSISAPRDLNGIPYPGFRATRRLEREFDFFCGFNSAGEPVFMFQSEVDYASYSSNTDNYHRWYGGSYRAYKDSAFHRVIFYSYSKATDSCTTLADLQGSDGWGSGTADYSASGYSGVTRLSGWIDSPIAGEGSVKYCYQLTNDRVAGWTTTGMRYKWDTSTDSFEVTPVSFDMGVSGASSFTELLLHPTSTAFMGNGTDDFKHGNCAMSCFFTEDGSGNYFLSFAVQYGGVDTLALSGSNSGGNIVSFSLDKTDMLSCTYLAHSKVDFLKAVSANVKGDTLLAIHSGSAKVWSWTANGFAEALSAPGNFFALTQRDDGNIWGVSMSERDTYAGGSAPQVVGTAIGEFNVSVELLSLDIPNSVSVVFEDTSIVYNGANITKNLLVNAYDTSGSRIATSVTLTISGVTATFQANGLDTLTLNTSDAQDTIIPLTITGAGFINVSASFAI